MPGSAPAPRSSTRSAHGVLDGAARPPTPPVELLDAPRGLVDILHALDSPSLLLQRHADHPVSAPGAPVRMHRAPTGASRAMGMPSTGHTEPPARPYDADTSPTGTSMRSTRTLFEPRGADGVAPGRVQGAPGTVGALHRPRDHARAVNTPDQALRSAPQSDEPSPRGPCACSTRCRSPSTRPLYAPWKNFWSPGRAPDPLQALLEVPHPPLPPDQVPSRGPKRPQPRLRRPQGRCPAADRSPSAPPQLTRSSMTCFPDISAVLIIINNDNSVRYTTTLAFNADNHRQTSARTSG